MKNEWVVQLGKKCSAIIRRAFRHKRIVIISDKEIVSLPLGPRTQFGLFLFITAIMVWLSYSSGRYFTYQEILSAKEREILHTNLTNESLQYRVSDLNKNLKYLDEYFQQISQYDHFNSIKKEQLKQETDDISIPAPAPEAPVKKQEENKPDSSKASPEKQENPEEIKNPGNDGASRAPEQEKKEGKEEKDQASVDTEVKGILTNIHHKILGRIKGLESLMELSGLTLNNIITEDYAFKKAAARHIAMHQIIMDQKNRKGSSAGGQGGPFEPAGKNNVDEEDVDPLVFEQQFKTDVAYLLLLERKIHLLPFTFPIEDAYVTSGFGRRVDPINRRAAVHYGIDFVAEDDKSIHATAPGIVKSAELEGAYGLMIELQHDNNITTRYGHLSKILVKEGQKVKRGDVIGYQGSTGRSTGAHLHYEIRFRNRPINPAKFLEAGKYVFQV